MPDANRAVLTRNRAKRSAVKAGRMPFLPAPPPSRSVANQPAMRAIATPMPGTQGVTCGRRLHPFPAAGLSSSPLGMGPSSEPTGPWCSPRLGVDQTESASNGGSDPGPIG